MKFRILSDLHLESNKFYYEWLGEDVLLLLGDIHTQNRHLEILTTVPQYVKIIMLAGNHEFYKDEFHNVNSTLKSFENQLSNFTFLNNQSIDIGNISIFGGTMWTDFELYGLDYLVDVKSDSQKHIRDFHIIRIDDRVWNTNDALNEFNKFNREFDFWVKNSEGKTRVCLTHFLPSVECVDVKFAGSILNGYFASNQENRIRLVDKWFFGHTHASCNFMFEETHLVCNPYGYGRENEYGFNNNLIIEIN